MKPYILGFLCSCFIVSQTIYTLFGRGDPAELVSAAPTLVWVFVAPIAISYSPLDDHSLRRSVLSCGAAGLCFTAVIAAAAFAAETNLGLESGQRLFLGAVVVAAVVGVPLSIGLVTLVDHTSRAVLEGE